MLRQNLLIGASFSGRVFSLLLVTVVAISCESKKAREINDVPAHPIGAAVKIEAPLGLPPLPIQDDNRPTADSITLGRRLFFDARLSSDNTLSCASCHSPALHFAEGRAVAKGVNGQFGTRNTPTVLNAVYNRVQFWDGRAASLEQQVGGPMANSKEMNQSHEVSVSKLSADSSYRAEFAKVFGPGEITMGKIEKAIAGFEQTLLSGNSPFDRYRYAGEKNAINASAIRGLAVFTDKGRGNCTACHIIGQKFALFSDGGFHNLGAGMNANGELTDLGRYEQTRVEADRGAFRTPSLRNAAKTAPYMHDGSLKTLKDVVDFYVGGANSNPQLDKEIKPLQLSAQDRNDLVVFLESLTGEVPKAAAQGKD